MYQPYPMTFYPQSAAKNHGIRQMFSPEEDEALKELVKKFGDKDWKFVARKMPGRTTRQCRERYKSYLAPEIKNGPWTKDEDELLRQKYEELGPKWAQIATFFKSRSDVNIKNRWSSLSIRSNQKNESKKAKLIAPPFISQLSLTQQPQLQIQHQIQHQIIQTPVQQVYAQVGNSRISPYPLMNGQITQVMPYSIPLSPYQPQTMIIQQWDQNDTQSYVNESSPHAIIISSPPSMHQCNVNTPEIGHTNSINVNSINLNIMDNNNNANDDKLYLNTRSNNNSKFVNDIKSENDSISINKLGNNNNYDGSPISNSVYINNIATSPEVIHNRENYKNIINDNSVIKNNSIVNNKNVIINTNNIINENINSNSNNNNNNNNNNNSNSNNNNNNVGNNKNNRFAGENGESSGKIVDSPISHQPVNVGNTLKIVTSPILAPPVPANFSDPLPPLIHKSKSAQSVASAQAEELPCSTITQSASEKFLMPSILMTEPRIDENSLNTESEMLKNTFPNFGGRLW
ncbi:hypothetical protein TRFO_16685 [Tritrichomonas foetus]|uniref:Myb-like DNA-binding domain containing protein n=1 Tax=Tritrichomonas foetus TaxID=1144522 RepID=A0A1J4KPM0_9EUKA|nr:hypothetical protein TRFO_16685 [Tritrichomonas foetus]|eukprot:OHT13239.1 hypothetical protein TRFO_16685 [Tritrichomonas foetus]